MLKTDPGERVLNLFNKTNLGRARHGVVCIMLLQQFSSYFAYCSIIQEKKLKMTSKQSVLSVWTSFILSVSRHIPRSALKLTADIKKSNQFLIMAQIGYVNQVQHIEMKQLQVQAHPQEIYIIWCLCLPQSLLVAFVLRSISVSSMYHIMCIIKNITYYPIIGTICFV